MKVFLNIEATEAELQRVAQALLVLAPENGTVAVVATAAPQPAQIPATTGVAGDISGGVKTPAPKRTRAPKAAAAPASAVPSLATLRAAAEQYANEHSVPEARAVLTRFGVERIADLPEAKRAEFLEAVSE